MDALGEDPDTVSAMERLAGKGARQKLLSGDVFVHSPLPTDALCGAEEEAEGWRRDCEG